MELQYWEEAPIPPDVQQMTGGLKYNFRLKRDRKLVRLVMDRRNDWYWFPPFAHRKLTGNEKSEAAQIMNALSDAEASPEGKGRYLADMVADGFRKVIRDVLGR